MPRSIPAIPAGRFRHRVLMMDADRMLTPTFRENVSDLKAAWKFFNRFLRLMRDHYGEFQYVAVPELQERGAWHFHLAVKGFYNVNLVRFFWRKAICGDGKSEVGAINITSPRKGGAWQRKKLVRYLCKYLGKELVSDLVYSRRYSSSQNISPPESYTFHIPIYIPIGDAAVYMMTKLVDAISPKGVQRLFEASGSMPVVWMASY